MTEKDKEIGRNIEVYRLLNGIPRRQVSEKIGISWQQVQKYEKGINRISIGRLYEIADALGIDVKELLT